MKKIGVTLNIDVTKIDKDHIYAGEKGKYITLNTFIDLEEKDQYGNSGMVTQEASDYKNKEYKGPILGNVKIFWSGGGESKSGVSQEQQSAPPKISFDDLDIPFSDPYKHCILAI